MKFEGLYQKRFESRYSTGHYCRWRCLIPKTARRVLDVGCGGGIFGYNKPDGYSCELYGLDISQTSVDNCLDTGRYKQVKKCDIQGKIPYPPNFFEVIFVDQLFEHLSDPLRAINNLKRVLSPKGILVINAPTPYHKKFWGDYTHVRPYIKETLEMLAKNSGFTEMRAFYYPHIDHMYYLPNKFRSRKMAWLIFNTVKNTFSDKKEVVVVCKK